jgi:hypothetical protein
MHIVGNLVSLPFISISISVSKSLHDHQMANTHNRVTNENNDNNNTDPPPPPTLEQVLIMQAQMLQTMKQSMANM